MSSKFSTNVEGKIHEIRLDAIMVCFYVEKIRMDII